MRLILWVFFDFNIFRHAGCHFFKIEPHFDPEVTSPGPAPVGTPGTAAPAAEEIGESTSSENIPKLAKDVIHIHSAAVNYTWHVLLRANLAGGTFSAFGPQLSFDCNCFHVLYLMNKKTFLAIRS